MFRFVPRLSELETRETPSVPYQDPIINPYTPPAPAPVAPAPVTPPAPPAPPAPPPGP